MHSFKVKISEGVEADVFMADAVKEELGKKDDTIARLEALLCKIDSELVDLLEGMYFGDVKLKFIKIIDECMAKETFEKAEDFLSNMTYLISVLFNKDNQLDRKLDWLNKLSEYRELLENKKKECSMPLILEKIHTYINDLHLENVDIPADACGLNKLRTMLANALKIDAYMPDNFKIQHSFRKNSMGWFIGDITWVCDILPDDDDDTNQKQFKIVLTDDEVYYTIIEDHMIYPDDLYQTYTTTNKIVFDKIDEFVKWLDTSEFKYLMNI